jgi:hypothetical protein
MPLLPEDILTKKHFIRAAEMVRSIADGNWIHVPPSWADIKGYEGPYIAHRDRAVQTAEAFIILAEGFNPRFDTRRFLVACGLVEAPIKLSKRKARV